jgi:nucleotide-binding universal stress UspA family protein
LISVNSRAASARETGAIPQQEKVMKILIAVDGSDYTKRMLAYIAAHDEWLGTRHSHSYTVIHGVLAVPHRAAAFVGQKVVREYYESDAELVLRPIRAFFAQQGIEARFLHTVGHVADSIAELAEEGKFDLVMMGSRGHGDLANLVLGSVATKVLAKCSVPVLLIR